MFYKSGHSSGGVGPSKLKTFSTLSSLVRVMCAEFQHLQSFGRPKLSILVAKNFIMAKFSVTLTTDLVALTMINFDVLSNVETRNITCHFNTILIGVGLLVPKLVFVQKVSSQNSS